MHSIIHTYWRIFGGIFWWTVKHYYMIFYKGITSMCQLNNFKVKWFLYMKSMGKLITSINSPELVTAEVVLALSFMVFEKLHNNIKIFITMRSC